MLTVLFCGVSDTYSKKKSFKTQKCNDSVSITNFKLKVRKKEGTFAFKLCHFFADSLLLGLPLLRD